MLICKRSIDVNCIFGLKIYVSAVRSRPGPPSNTKYSHPRMAFFVGFYVV